MEPIQVYLIIYFVVGILLGVKIARKYVGYLDEPKMVGVFLGTLLFWPIVCIGKVILEEDKK